MSTRKKTKPRKLLVASIGIATLTIGQGCFGSGNLVAPPPTDSGIRRDAGSLDGGTPLLLDAGRQLEDAGFEDGGRHEDGGLPEDAGLSEDAGSTDDAGALDAGSP